MRYFGIGFLVFLFFEIMSIVWVADWLGAGWTLFLMIGSFLLGSYMLRRLGFSGVLVAVAAARSGSAVSLYQLLWPIRYAVSAVLLMSPGFVSMLLAVLLMLPIKGRAIASGTANMGGGFARRQTTPRDDDIIDGEYTVTRPNGKPSDETLRLERHDR